MVDTVKDIALSSLVAQFRRMEMIANNVANINTTGYRKKDVLFAEYLSKTSPTQKVSYVQDKAAFSNTMQGELQVTDNPLDVAIIGEGFITVQTPAGIRYTRNGAMGLDANGALVNSEGFPISTLDGGLIEIPAEDPRELRILSPGIVALGADAIGQIGIAEFENPYELLPESGTLYKPQEGVEPLPAENTKLVQGARENSNVHPVMEMTEMMLVKESVAKTQEISDRMFELERRAMQIYGRPQRN
jgi:flagellar basal-body rod protein FlgF